MRTSIKDSGACTIGGLGHVIGRFPKYLECLTFSSILWYDLSAGEKKNSRNFTYVHTTVSDERNWGKPNSRRIMWGINSKLSGEAFEYAS